MRSLTIAAVLFAVSITASAQRHKLENLKTDTPEGQLLRQADTESDEAKKLTLLEAFIAKFPQHEGAAWAYEQAIAGFTKAGQYEKVMAAGDKLLALDPSDVENAWACLQAAEAKKDPDLIVRWSGTTAAAAHKVIESPKPAGTREALDWERRVDWAKQVDLRSEYSLYATLLQTPDPKKKVALGEALEQRNPQSQYLAQMTEQRFNAYVQAGESPKALALAEKSIESGQGSVEMMLASGQDALAKKKEARAMTLGKQALDQIAAKQKPEGTPDADWQNWKTQLSARAHWIIGRACVEQQNWLVADQEFRAALPGIQGSRELLAEALFYAGLANYRLAEAGQKERAADALRFSQQCAAIPGPFQAPATKNAAAIRSRYRVK